MRASLLYVGFFFQAEDGIRDLVRSRGLGDVYKRQILNRYYWSADGGRTWENDKLTSSSGVFGDPVIVLSLIHI